MQATCNRSLSKGCNRKQALCYKYATSQRHGAQGSDTLAIYYLTELIGANVQVGILGKGFWDK